ncbi:hypothetical protein BDV93DRAFT_293726 [Ceratobasidium sp. AG-I]|nr:hypothetical protein BDV93DRAFT_293726 [Ceratobasidium sp. AG-I]
MSELHVWSYYQLKGILKLATGFFNTSWDKDTIMQAVTCVYEENHWFFYNLHAFMFLTLSTSALNNPLVHESPLLSNRDTCVALYQDPSLPKTHPILFGYVFTVILSLGLRSSVWTKQLTRDDRNILYAAQAHLASLGDDYFLEFSWISQSPAKNRSEYCSDSCTKYANTAWSASFASFAVLDSAASLMDASKLALLPSYRHLFVECTRPVFKSCKCKCARKALRRIDEGIEDIFYAMCCMHEYLVENA